MSDITEEPVANSGDTEIDVDLFAEDVETTEEEVTETEQTVEPEAEEVEESTEEEATETEEETATDDEAIKAHNAEMAQRRIAEKNARIEAEQKRLAEQNAYLKDAETDEDLRLRQLEVDAQNRAIREYERTIEFNKSQVLGDYERVLSDPSLKMFNEKSESFNRRQFERMQRSFEAENVRADQQGNIIEVKDSFYKFAKEWAEDFNTEAKVNQAKGQKIASRTLAKAEPPSSSVNKIPQKKDPLDELWDEQAIH